MASDDKGKSRDIPVGPTGDGEDSLNRMIQELIDGVKKDTHTDLDASIKRLTLLQALTLQQQSVLRGQLQNHDVANANANANANTNANASPVYYPTPDYNSQVSQYPSIFNTNNPINFLAHPLPMTANALNSTYSLSGQTATPATPSVPPTPLTQPNASVTPSSLLHSTAQPTSLASFSSQNATVTPNNTPARRQSLTSNDPEEDRRRRNTEASARFRAKKKQREEEKIQTNLHLRDRVTALEKEAEALINENRWLRDLLAEKINTSSIDRQLLDVIRRPTAIAATSDTRTNRDDSDDDAE